MDIFDYLENDNVSTILADRMRPNKLDDFIGQEHILSPEKVLYKMISEDKLSSSIFYGPPGVGKTTIANIIEKKTKCNFVKLNAISSGIAEAKKVIENAKENSRLYKKKTILFLDECHRWSKAQSDSVLEAVENGTIIFIGSTTENPYANMTNALVSRCKVYEFRPLSDKDIMFALEKALADKENGYGNFDTKINIKLLEKIVYSSSGDLRSALNTLEILILSKKPNKDGVIELNEDDFDGGIEKRSLSINVDTYYDMLSAFCKSLRGSDSDAALYYAERMIQGGVDPLIILRRLVVHSSEDVGMADPNALVVATSALTAFTHLGLPEGKIPMYNAIIYVCEAPKSNSVVLAKYKVEEVVKNHNDDNIPTYLKDNHFAIDKSNASKYLYPHDYENAYVKQDYLPNSLKDEFFYMPKTMGFEKNLIGKRINRDKDKK